MTKAYSRNEENFYADLHDVLMDMDTDGNLEVGVSLWEGEVKHPTGASLSFGVVDQVIDQLQENAYEEAGEFAEAWLTDVPQEKLRELGDLISQWIDTNAPPRFFTVQDVKKLEITEEMIANYKGLK